MLLSRRWRNLALGMLTVTILCNVFVLKQMPDSPSRSMKAVANPKDLLHPEPRVSRDSTSRKLGFTNSTTSKVTKRWVYSIGAASERHSNSKASQSSGASTHSDTTAQAASSQTESSEQLYMSHPRFGQQSLPAQSSDGQTTTGAAERGIGGALVAAEEVGNIASSLHGNASEARPQNLVQLSEAFRQQQEQLAAVVKATGNASEDRGAMQAQPEQRNRAPGLEDALHGKAPVLETVSSLPQKGLPAQVIQAYPGQSALTQQQQESLESERGQAAEEHAAFASLAESGVQASAAQNASEVRQQVLADVATQPRAPVDKGNGTAPILAQPMQNVTVDPTCFDEEAGCPAWAAGDGCIQTGPGFMLEKCRRSCQVCGQPYTRGTASKVTLNNGVEMPLVGFGTAGLGAETKQAVAWALQAGYRLLDSAQAPEWYREDLVGQAVIESGIPREELFLTSKLHPRHHGYDAAMIQFTRSISALAVEYVDLFLLHYPACWPELCGAGAAPAGRWQDSWKALETLVDKGLIRAIGVSNFDIDELAELLAMARIKPALVQRHSDPLSADAATQALCRLAGVQYQGYSTLGSQWLMQGFAQNVVLQNAVVQAVAQEAGRDTAQVVLKWALQHGQAVVPRSSKQERIAANRELDFELSDAQMRRIDALDGIVVPGVA